MFSKKNRISTAVWLLGLVVVMTPSSGVTKSVPPLTLLETEDVKTLAARAWAVAYAPVINRGSLLMLRGGFGRALVSFRNSDGMWCDPLPMRMLTGDFSGTSIGIGNAGPAAVLIMNSTIAEAMRNGEDIVSDSLNAATLAQISSESQIGADVIVLGSAAASDGFVFNMGNSLLDDIFGVDEVSQPCVQPNAGAALSKAAGE